MARTIDRLRTGLRAVLFAAMLTPKAPSAEQWKPKVVEPSTTAPAMECLEAKSAAGKPYWYRLPKKLSANRPATLLVMLHGTGMNQGWPFYNYPLLDGRWRKDDVILAPEGMTPGNGDTFNFLQGQADGDHLAGLIELFKKKLPIGRVYLYGHSQGAFFCYWFAGEHPELVDGIVAHAGNVLDVKHGKLAQEKVAIGILHGRADAVVPVECAFRTEKIYREQGYQKLKLYVVEGLNEQTGHWPLPLQVGEMLDWLDQVSVQSAGQALSIALDQLTRETPDVTVIAESIAAAEKLLGKAKAGERAAVEKSLAALRELLATAATAHAEALTMDPALADPKLPYGKWAAHFRAVDSALATQPSWQKALKPARSLAEKHEKAVESALAKFDASKAAPWKTAAQEFTNSYLAQRVRDLGTKLAVTLDAPPAKGVTAKDFTAIRDRIAEREQPEVEGLAAANEITKRVVAEFVAAHPDLAAPSSDGS